MYSRILVGYDGSDGARSALRQAVELAKTVGAQLSSIATTPRCRAGAGHARAPGARGGVDRRHGAGRELDLLVIGYHGHSWAARPQSVVRLAPCSVLLAK